MPERILEFTDQLDLQIALYIIGGVIFFGLLLHNTLRNRQLKNRLMANLAQAAMQEAVEAPSSKEPHFGAQHLPAGHPADNHSLSSSAFVSDTLEPSSGGFATSVQDDGSGVQPSSISFSAMDPNIDCVVNLKVTLAVTGAEVIEKISQWPSRHSYRLFYEGQFESAGSNHWEALIADHAYRELQVSIQLANRRGPIHQEDLAEFLGLASQLAQEIDAEIDLPPMTQVLALAQDLDHFAVQCDIQLSFSVIPNMINWAPQEVDAVLVKNGCVLSRDGLSFAYSSQGQAVFKAQVPSLNFLTDDLQSQRIKNIVFALEVPLVDQDQEAFATMYDVARRVAADLDGRVLDDNGQVLESQSIGMIVAQLQPIYALMLERQIPSGSATAARLFS